MTAHTTTPLTDHSASKSLKKITPGTSKNKNEAVLLDKTP
jgi:hypothetical protein